MPLTLASYYRLLDVCLARWDESMDLVNANNRLLLLEQNRLNVREDVLLNHLKECCFTFLLQSYIQEDNTESERRLNFEEYSRHKLRSSSSSIPYDDNWNELKSVQKHQLKQLVELKRRLEAIEKKQSAENQYLDLMKDKKMEGDEDQQEPYGPLVSNSLSHDLRPFVNAKQFADVILEVEGSIVYAHKAILCARSSHFRVSEHFYCYLSQIY